MERFTCPKCNGERRVKVIETVETESWDGKGMISRTYPTTIMCRVCSGTGEVDWVTNMTQRDDNTVPF